MSFFILSLLIGLLTKIYHSKEFLDLEIPLQKLSYLTLLSKIRIQFPLLNTYLFIHFMHNFPFVTQYLKVDVNLRFIIRDVSFERKMGCICTHFGP